MHFLLMRIFLLLLEVFKTTPTLQRKDSFSLFYCELVIFFKTNITANDLFLTLEIVCLLT